MRPSLNSVDTKGMVAQGFMDTVGFFARSAAVLDKVQKCLSTSSIHGPSSNSTTGMRYKLLYPIQPENADPSGYPKWFPRPGSSSTPEVEEGLSIFETVIKNLETHLDCQRHIFDLEELWSKTRPSDMDANLAKATGTIYQRLVYYATAHDVILPFIHDYKAANDGRSPYLEPIFKKRIQYGIAVTKEEYEEALQHFVTFKKWLHDHLFKSQPGENIVLVFPQTWGIPSYRDDTTPVPESYEPSAIFWEGFSVYSLSYISGCPDITVPVGEVCYTSRITDHEEWLPISLSFLSQPGNDSVLTSLLRDLEDKGVLRPTQTGARAYAG